MPIDSTKTVKPHKIFTDSRKAEIADFFFYSSFSFRLPYKTNKLIL